MKPRLRRHAKEALRRTVVGAGIAYLALHALGLLYAVVPVPLTPNMVFTRPDGTQLQRDWTPMERISPHMAAAVIAAEDSRFCGHDGIDWAAISEAARNNRDGGGRRGGSTLTQQTAKNVFLWNGGGYARKAVEAWLALYIDTVWTKRRILEVYLNVAEWGDGIYGVEAAAKARFGKSAADLSEREAALLAAVLPNPNDWRADPPGPYVRGRASTLQQRARMVRNDGLDACVRR